MIVITAVHLVGGELHEHIQSVRWLNETTNATGQSSRAEMVEYIRANPNTTVVGYGVQRVFVGVWDASPPYIRTYSDGKWSNNLLSLPRY